MKKTIFIFFCLSYCLLYAQSSHTIDEYNSLYKFMPTAVKAYERIIENNPSTNDELITIEYKRLWLVYWIKELYFNDSLYDYKISAIHNQLNTAMMIYQSTKNLEACGNVIYSLDEYAAKNYLYGNIIINGKGIYDIIKNVIKENIVDAKNEKQIYEIMIGWKSHIIKKEMETN